MTNTSQTPVHSNAVPWWICVNDLSSFEAHEIGWYCLWGLFPLFAIVALLLPVGCKEWESQLRENGAFFLPCAAGVVWGLGYFRKQKIRARDIQDSAPERVYYLLSVAVLLIAVAVYVSEYSLNPMLRYVVMVLLFYPAAGWIALLCRLRFHRRLRGSLVRVLGPQVFIVMRAKANVYYFAMFLACLVTASALVVLFDHNGLSLAWDKRQSPIACKQ